MAGPFPAGSDVSAGTYQCTNCGYKLDVGSTQHLPPCPNCDNGSWSTQSGGGRAGGETFTVPTVPGPRVFELRPGG